jgi:hypothetical protein
MIEDSGRVLTIQDIIKRPKESEKRPKSACNRMINHNSWESGDTHHPWSFIREHDPMLSWTDHRYVLSDSTCDGESSTSEGA